MFGLALCAASRPAHEDWLKEWSSTPPVSSTMQAFRLPPAADVPELVGVVGLLVAVELLGLPQPAISSDAAPRAATILMVWRKRDLLSRPAAVRRGKCWLT